MQHLEKQIDGQKLLYAWFTAMYTRVDLLLVSENKLVDLISVAEKINKTIDKVETFANRFNENSELSKINNTAFLQPYFVSNELFEIIVECIDFYKKTLGYFDITVNSMNGFSKGITNIVLNNSKKTISFQHDDVKLDLSGFIKGYVLRKIKVVLVQENIHNALINIGNSSILAIGNHPQGEGWKVSIAEAEIAKEYHLLNQCFTTSGNKDQTKWPIKNPKALDIIANHKAQSVITDDPGLGEVLAKAFYIASDDEKNLILNNFDEEISWLAE